MSAENVKMNNNPSAGEYVVLKKSMVKTIIVIAAAVIIGGLGAWYVNSVGRLSFSISNYGSVLEFIVAYEVYAIAAVAAVLSVSAIVFRFVRFSYKVFVPVSAAVSLLIGVRVVYDHLFSMLPSEFPIPEYVDSTGSAILFLSPIGLAVAAVVFVLSLTFGLLIRQLAVRCR